MFGNIFKVEEVFAKYSRLRECLGEKCKVKGTCLSTYLRLMEVFAKIFKVKGVFGGYI